MKIIFFFSVLLLTNPTFSSEDEPIANTSVVTSPLMLSLDKIYTLKKEYKYSTLDKASADVREVELISFIMDFKNSLIADIEPTVQAFLEKNITTLLKLKNKFDSFESTQNASLPYKKMMRKITPAICNTNSDYDEKKTKLQNIAQTLSGGYAIVIFSCEYGHDRENLNSFGFGKYKQCYKNDDKEWDECVLHNDKLGAAENFGIMLYNSLSINAIRENDKIVITGTVDFPQLLKSVK